MTFLSDDEAKALRIALGLDSENRHYPRRNKLNVAYVERYRAAVDSLVKVELMETREAAGVLFYAATPAGRVAVLDHPWKH